MPHAHKACPQKKKERRKKKKDSPNPKKKKQEGDDSYNRVHPPSTKNIYIDTLAHLDQGL